MNAAISGTKGFALIVDGEAVDVIHLDGRRGSAHATHVRRMLDEPGDTCFIECRDLADVQWRLQEATDAADALQLTLIALDSQLSSDTRREACGELTKLLEADSTVAYVERVLYARPLGLEHDLHGARGFASSRPLGDFFKRLDAVQPASVRVATAWEQIPEGMFVEASRAETFVSFVKLGLVRDLVELVAAGNNDGHAMLLPTLFALYPRLRDIDGDASLVTRWIALADGLERAAASYDAHLGEEMAAEDGISEERAYTVAVAPKPEGPTARKAPQAVRAKAEHGERRGSVLLFVLGVQFGRPEFADYLRTLDAALNADEPFAMVVDGSDPMLEVVELPNKRWQLSRAVVIGKLHRGIAFVTGSMTRERVQALYALQPPGVPYAFFTDRNEAIEWGHAVVEAQRRKKEQYAARIHFRRRTST